MSRFCVIKGTQITLENNNRKPVIVETGTTRLKNKQGGDYQGGGGWDRPKRKAMNSFVCATDRPFKFSGRTNEDVNAYVRLGHKGDIMLTQMKTSIIQKLTQSNEGGLTELYLEIA